MSNGKFDLNEFVKESKDVLLNPKSCFSSMPLQGGISDPLIKALIYGTVAGIFILIWNILNLGGTTGIMFGGVAGVMSLIWYIIASGIGLFIGAVILLVISSICKGNTDFEANARVTAAAMVLMPFSAFFSFASGINHFLGSVISFAINIFGVWLLYNGLIWALKAKPSTVRIIAYVFAALLVLTLIMSGSK